MDLTDLGSTPQKKEARRKEAMKQAKRSKPKDGRIGLPGDVLLGSGIGGGFALCGAAAQYQTYSVLAPGGETPPRPTQADHWVQTVGGAEPQADGTVLLPRSGIWLATVTVAALPNGGGGDMVDYQGLYGSSISSSAGSGRMIGMYYEGIILYPTQTTMLLVINGINDGGTGFQFSAGEVTHVVSNHIYSITAEWFVIINLLLLTEFTGPMMDFFAMANPGGSA